MNDYDFQIITGKRCSATPTKYKDKKFRSKLEAKWAAYFQNIGAHWGYEIETAYETPYGNYCPDFFIPKTGWFIEVKATRDLLSDIERNKINYFKEHLPAFSKGILTVFGDPENTYDKQFLNNILGVNRTENEVKLIESEISAMRFETFDNDNIYVIYQIRRDIDDTYESLYWKVIENLQKVCTKIAFGNADYVKRDIVIKIKDGCRDSQLEKFVHFDIIPYGNDVHNLENIKNKINNITIKPFPAKRALTLLTNDVATGFNSWWDFIIDAKINGGYSAKIKSEVLNIRVEVVDNNGCKKSDKVIYVKIIPDIDVYSDVIREIVGYKKIVNNMPKESIFVLVTNNIEHKSVFESHGIVVVLSSEIGE